MATESSSGLKAEDLKCDSSLSSRDSKLRRILEACKSGDIDELVALATSERGLLYDELRQIAWPILLGSQIGHDKEVGWQSLPAHRDEDQVKLDVNRSFVYYPTIDSEKQLEVRKEQLQAVIVEVLRRHPSLCYFQGYHDIVQVLLLVLGTDASPALVRRLSLLRIRDFLLPNLSASVTHLYLLPAILYNADRELYKILPSNPFYGLSHVLTLYAHDIQSYPEIARLFDFLLAREAATSIYLFAVIIMSKREELLELMADDADPNVMSVVLSKLPQNTKWETYIQETVELFNRYPPERLPLRAWGRISQYSVLKTTRSRDRTEQTLEDGQSWFDKQALEIKRQEMRAKAIQAVRQTLWENRRLLTYSASFAVCLVAYYAQKTAGSGQGLGFLRRLFWVPAGSR